MTLASTVCNWNCFSFSPCSVPIAIVLRLSPPCLCVTLGRSVGVPTSTAHCGIQEARREREALAVGAPALYIAYLHVHVWFLV